MMPGIPNPHTGIGTQAPSSPDNELVWTMTQPWHFYVVLGVALILAIWWALHLLRRWAAELNE